MNPDKVKNLSLALAPIKACSCVIFVIYFMTGIYWMYDENRQYKRSISQAENGYFEKAREKVQVESSILLRTIEEKERDVQLLINKSLQEKVRTAHTLASHFYGLEKSHFPVDTMKVTITEALRPLRWSNSNGFYFIFDRKNQTYVLHSKNPEWELESLKNREAQQVVAQKVSDILHLKNSGFYRGYFSPSEILKEENLYFIKKFPAFDWVIGGGVSYQDIRTTIQESVVQQMQRFHSSEGGRVLCFDQEGIALVDTKGQLNGFNLSLLKNAEEQVLVEKVTHALAGEVKSAFFQYTDSEDGKNTSHIAYIQKHAPWDWTIVSIIPLGNLDKVIVAEKERFKKSLTQGATVYFFVVLLTFVIVFLIAHYYSVGISRSLRAFSRFFSHPDSAQTAICKEDIVYTEFRQIGAEITHLVKQRDDHIAKLIEEKSVLSSLQKISHQSVTTASLQDISATTLASIQGLLQSKNAYIVLYDSLLEDFKLLASSFVCEKVDSDQFSVIKDLESCLSEHAPAKRGVFPDDINLEKMFVTSYRIDEHQRLMVHCSHCLDGKEQKEKDVIRLLQEMWDVRQKQTKDFEQRDSRDILQSINENLPSNIIVINSDYKLLFASVFARKNFGLQIIQNEEHDCFHQLPLLCDIKAQIHEAVTDKRYLSAQCSGEDSTGGFYSYLVHVSPISLSRLNGVILRLEDRSKRVQLDRTLAESEKMLSVAGIVTGIAYELDKPLASLNGHIESIESVLSLRKPHDKKEQLHCDADCKGKGVILEELSKIKTDSAQANKLLSEMLSFSQRDGANHKRSYVDVAELLDISLDRAVVKNAASLNRDVRMVRVEKEYKTIEMLNCHQENIQQVFINIFTNALYAVSRKFSDLTDGCLLVRMYQDMCWLTIEIEDNGEALDEEKSKRVFEPFYTTKKDARGLGLSVASYIVTDLHEGQITVYQTKDSGKCFQIQLPVKKVL